MENFSDVDFYQESEFKGKRFKLSENFIAQYTDRNPPMDIVGLVTYYRTYSRYIENENRNEHWFETVRRVVEGCYNTQKQHCITHHLEWKESKAQKSAQRMYDKVYNFKFTPPGRGLWLMGTNYIVERGGGALNNCSATTTEDIELRKAYPFAWATDALMLGCGVSSDLKGAGKMLVKQPKETKRVYQIPDTREGWVNSVYLLLNSYFNGSETIELDYSLIRPEGLPIKGFGGTSSGPEPLKTALERMRKLLDGRVGLTLSAVDIVDLYNHIASFVVAGNVRRSAMLMMGDSNDEDFIDMKNYEKYPEECMERRWASNNSIEVKVGKTDYKKYVKNIVLNGEPGFIWMDNVRKYGRMIDPPDYADMKACTLNPCAEISLEPYEQCNLVEVYPSHHDTYEEFEETLKYAYMYGKTVSLIETRWPDTNKVLLKNRRLGVSQSGIIDAFKKHGRRTMLEWCDKGYKRLRELDAEYSDWFCIPRSKKLTAVKPSGSISLLANVSPGIHYPHSEYYIRRIRISSTSPLCDILEEAGYKWNYEIIGRTEEEKRRTKVFEFPRHTENYDKSKADVSVWEQIKNCSDYLKYWTDNNVSITVTFKDNEIEEIPRAVEAFEDTLKSLSFLKLDQTAYKLPPYEEITKKQYEDMWKDIKPIDFKKINLFGVHSHPGKQTREVEEKFCEGDQCQITFETGTK